MLPILANVPEYRSFCSDSGLIVKITPCVQEVIFCVRKISHSSRFAPKYISLKGESESFTFVICTPSVVAYVLGAE
jgi:hypothetical protein